MSLSEETLWIWWLVGTPVVIGMLVWGFLCLYLPPFIRRGLEKNPAGWIVPYLLLVFGLVVALSVIRVQAGAWIFVFRFCTDFYLALACFGAFGLIFSWRAVSKGPGWRRVLGVAGLLLHSLVILYGHDGLGYIARVI